MKYIQSFYQYPVTFSSIGKTIAARNAVGEMKNIVEISEKELEKLKNSEPFFRELLNKKKIRILDKLPNSYVPPAQQINKAQDEAAQSKAEADRLRKELEAAKAKIAELEVAKTPAEDTISDGATTDNVGSTDPAKTPTEETTTEKSSEVETTSLEATSYEGLKEIATKLGIEFKANVKKFDLIKMIKEAEAKAE